MVAHIFGAIGDAITAFAGVLGNGFTSLLAIFYDATSGLTAVGTLALIGVGVGIVYWAFRLVRNLISVRGM